MKKPPIYYKPGTWQPLNGQLPDGVHAGEIDQFACWLATRRLPIPCGVGAPIGSVSGLPTQTYTELLHVPHYCEHVAFLVNAWGNGAMQVKSSDDSYTAGLTVATTPSISGVPVYEEAKWHQLVMPMDSVTTGNQARAVDVDDLSSEHVITLEWTVALGVYLFEIVPWFLPRRFDSELPA